MKLLHLRNYIFKNKVHEDNRELLMRLYKIDAQINKSIWVKMLGEKSIMKQINSIEIQHLATYYAFLCPFCFLRINVLIF